MTDTRDVFARLSAAVADRYTILRELGVGGMATVYLAEDLKHDRKVALKVLKPELAAVLGAERFIVEIKTTAALQHPHILPLFDSGTADGFLFYVMPFIDGETLRDKLNRETQLGVDDAVRIATDVAEALEYAHQHGVIHRDIKPENILLANGRPMVADFGIALAVSAAAGGRMTETGLSLGTPHYMSPEQATAEKDISARSDVYSLASVLYEMLAGQPPHLGGSAQQIIMKIITETPADVTTLRKSVPANVAAALAKALEKVPADRFASAKEFGAALSNATYMGAYSGARQARTRSTWKDRAALPLAGAAVLMLGAALWGWLRPRPSESHHVSRFEISLPDSAGLTQQPGILFALSDDGSQIVYVGPGPGDIDLFARPVNSLVSTRIPATNGADSPFLSPNGDQVAFYRGNPNALYLVSLRGGPRRTLATDSTLALGGDWGPDGAIYFTRANGIRRLPAGGGSVEEVTRLDKGNGDVAHAWVDVLPNGKAALFTITRATSSLYDIAVVDLRSHEVRILFRGTCARYSPTGHIVYTTAEGGLFAIGFDDNSLTTNGAVIPIAAGLAIGANGMGSFALSADGTLLYGTGAATESELLLWVDRKGNEQVIDSTPGVEYDRLALSPDGKRVAMAVNSPTQILTKDLQGGPTSILTTDGINGYPSWSVDGRFVRFTRTAPSGPAGLVQRRADGSAPTEQAVALAASTAKRGHRSYVVSPNGEWAVFELRETGQELASLMAQRLKADTTAIAVGAPSSTTQNAAPRFSPDGRWLAYVSAEADGAKPEVVVTPFPNTTTSRVQVSVSGGLEPLWSRDGRELFYTDADGFLTSARIETAPDFRVASRTRLFSREGYTYTIPGSPYYDISPDGTRFIMSRPARSKNSERLVVVLNWFDELRASGKGGSK
jgi:serine/threonine protein kinase/Tol biopolymer transport system component